MRPSHARNAMDDVPVARAMRLAMLALLAPLALLAASCVAGCTALGAAAYVIGPPAVQPKYVPAKVPMLVLAENYGAPTSLTMSAEQLEQMVMEELRLHGIAPPAPQFQRVYELRASQPQQFRAMSIAALGRLAEAEQVLYIDLRVHAGDVAPGAGMLKAQASANVKVVDVTTGETLWPEEMAGGYPVKFETQFTRADQHVTPATLRQAVQQGLTDRIVKLFRKYKPDDDEVE